MTTQHLHHEHSDADVPTPVVEDLSAPETVTPPPQAETAPVEGQEETRDKSIASQHEEATASSADATGDISRPGESAPDTETQNQVEEPATTVPTSSETGEGDVAAETVSGDEQEVRPFTAFIEEFQQEQARLGVAQPEQEAETFAAFSSETVPAPLLAPEFVAPWQQTVASAPETRAAETAATPAAQETGEVPEFLAALNKIIAERPTSAETAATAEPGETAQGNTEEAAPAAQAPATPPVSPLLRPPSRIRVPRHHTRQREESTHAAQTTPASTTKQVQEESSPATAAPAEAATSAGTDAQAPATPEAGQTRPARRYRFDRPARTEERRESTNRAGTPAQTPTPATQENGNGQTPAEHTNPQELQGQKHSAPAQPVEPATTKTAAVTEAATETAASSQAGTGEHEPHERRRRHGQERQREKEQPQAAPAVTAPAASTPAAEPVVQPAPAAQTPEPAPVAAQPEEVNPEDLPPLEYAELQAANSRRRRRRRSPTVANAAPAAPASNAPLAAKPATPDTFTPGTPAVPSAPAPAPVPAPHVTPIPAQYNIVSGYTVSQMNQNGDGIGPFMGPDPSPARGSTPGHALRSGRAEVQRAPAYPPMRTEPSGASVHHLATVVAQAIQTQTDRMVAELRRANQGPTNVAVTLPPFPSTERVGVFVDVANLLYSARTMRINIDFGKLLDFLRGNRRLVRAQAYCPTSPQAGDEQMFLQAVKGLGYRITTKNYKTFSSGAKKADLDLDLCMDVVRLVDGRAVDCIVLVSGDSDFMPMLDYCSDHGVRVEVAAFDEAMSATLRQSCDLFINLSMLPEIRA